MLRDYRNFKANSINNYLSDEEKNQIIELQNKIKELEEKKKQLSKNVTIKVKGNTNRSGNFVRKCFIIDYEYTKEQMAEIFNLKARTNGKYKITFRNSTGYYSEVLDVEKDAEGNFLFYNNSPVIRVRFGTFETKMTVNKFLHLVSINDFTDIKPSKFYYHYLRYYKSSEKYKEDMKLIKTSLLELNNELETLYNKYSVYENMYNQNKEETEIEYNKIQQEYDRLKKQAVTQSSVEKKYKETKNGILKIRSLWNTLIKDSDKAKLLGWMCKNIYSMRCYVLKGGASELCMDREDAYPDYIYGKKKRTIPLYNDEGLLISNDSVNGYIRLNTVDNAPTECILPLCQKKDAKDLFKENRLNDLNLMLFLLAEYNEYGFKVGKTNLFKDIDYIKLRDEKFPNNKSDFDLGFNL